MDVLKPNPTITDKTILSYLTQEQIMNKYLGKTSKTGMFCSPLRQDENPTCTLTWIDGKLLFTDWAIGKPLDCFGVVMEMYGCGYHKAQKIIAKDFDLVRNINEGSLSKRDVKQITFKKGSGNHRQKVKIDVKVQNFTQDTIDYLKSYHLTYQITKKFNVFCPKYVWVNGRLDYVYHHSNPALAYYFGTDKQDQMKWKIYFYEDENIRFKTNTNRINGWVQLPKTAENLVITKSLKDVMCLDIVGVPAIAMQAETQTPYDYIIKELKSRFTNIISLYDHDEAGITRAKSVKQLYDIPCHFIKDPKAKDFSDYIKHYGVEKANSLIKDIL